MNKYSSIEPQSQDFLSYRYDLPAEKSLNIWIHRALDPEMLKQLPGIPVDPRGSGGSFSLVHTPEISGGAKGKNLDLPTPSGANDFDNWLLPTPSGAPETRETSRVATFRKYRLAKTAQKMDECGQKTVSWYCPECELRPWVRVYCGVRVCSICYWRKFGSKFKAKREQIYPRFMRQRGRNGRNRVMFLTLTTINLGRFPSRERAREIIGLAVKFCRGRYKGWDVVPEIKITKTGPFLHIHAVVFGDYIPQAKLGADWEALTGAKNVWIEVVEDPKKAVGYLSGYLGKGVPVKDYELQARYLKAFQGTRRVRTGGVFYNLEKEVKDDPSRLDFRECPRCGAWGLHFDRENQGVTVLLLRIRGDPLQVFSFKEAYRIWQGGCSREVIDDLSCNYQPAQRMRKAA